MKRSIRIISLVLSIVLIFAIPVSAEDAQVRSSSYFSTYSAQMYKNGTREIQIWFDVLGTYTMEKIGASWIEIQRSSDGSTWTTMKTAYPEDYPQMMKENAYFCTDYITYFGTVGYYYRACVKFYAKRGNGSGALYHYTNVLKL